MSPLPIQCCLNAPHRHALNAPRAVCRKGRLARTRRRALASMKAERPSNKPMVPTADASPATNPSHLLRRHIGQPFGSFNDQRIRGRDSSLRRRQTE